MPLSVVLPWVTKRARHRYKLGIVMQCELNQPALCGSTADDVINSMLFAQVHWLTGWVTEWDFNETELLDEKSDATLLEIHIRMRPTLFLGLQAVNLTDFSSFFSVSPWYSNASLYMARFLVLTEANMKMTWRMLGRVVS